MKFPDGSLIKLGDVVWWDDENAIGSIINIHETEEECKNVGVEEPGILICFDGSGIGGLIIGYPQRTFVEEGVRRLTPVEQREVNNVVRAARSYSSEKLDEITTGLFRKKTNNLEFWNVIFYRNRQALRVIEVDPSNLSCREIEVE